METRIREKNFCYRKKLQRGITSGVLGFTWMCQMLGAVPGAKTTKIALEDPTEKDADLMSLDRDEKILVLEHICR